jgi:hypothetical protein
VVRATCGTRRRPVGTLRPPAASDVMRITLGGAGWPRVFAPIRQNTQVEPEGGGVYDDHRGR